MSLADDDVDRTPQPEYYDRLPQPWGEPLATEYLSQTAAPLLAGFSFAMVALILQVQDKLREPDLALALLIAAALLLVNAVQLGSIARRYYIGPSDWKELLAIAPLSAFPGLQFSGPRALDKHANWLLASRLVYNIGVVVLLAAVAVSLVPARNLDPIEGWRWAAIAIAAAGGVLQGVVTAVNGVRAVRWNREVRRLAADVDEEEEDLGGEPGVGC